MPRGRPRVYQGPLRTGERSARVPGLTRTEVKQTRKIAKKVVNSALETKLYNHSREIDYEFTLTQPFVTDFLNIPQGTTDDTREGDEILFQQLKVNLDITGSVDGTVKSGLPVDRVRVLLVKWRESDYVGGSANTPSYTDIFGTNLPIGTNLFTAMVNHHENGRRFKILYDKKLTLCGDIGNMINCDSPERKQKFLTINVGKKKYGNKKVKYDNINPSINSHMNGLFLMVVTDNPGGATQSSCTLSMDARVLFKDA